MADCQSLISTLKGMSPGDVGYEDQLDKVFGCLNKRIGDLEGGFNKATQSAREFASAIGEGNDMVTSIFESFAKAQANAVKFATNIQRQYRLGEDIAESYKKVSVNIGIGYQNQRRLGDEFSKSLALVTEIGGDLSDVSAIYTRFAENSGRVRILDDEEVQRIFAIEQATGLMGDSAAALAERFDLIGIGSEQFAENINQIVKDSQKIGLNSSKVVKVLSDNFESMQRMSFRGGVKAMTEMSKLAVKMRMDISEMLGMADRFYEPEAAIEAAANLQLLGGEIANSFGDPLQMMFEARNAPEELMKRVGDVTQGLVKFNEETGQFDILAENRQKLLGMADALGINKDQLIDTAFQMNKMQRIKMDVGGSLFDDEEKLDKIASIAKFDKATQQWMVDIGGKPVAVEDLNTDQLEQALATPKTEEDAIMETAKAAMTTNQLLEQLVAKTEIEIINQTKVYEAFEANLKPLLGATMDFNKTVVAGVAKGIEMSPIDEKVAPVIAGATTALEVFTESLGGAQQVIDDFVNLDLPTEIDTNTLTRFLQRVITTGAEFDDATIRPTMNSGGKVSSFDPGDEFLIGKSGGPLSGYLAEMNEKLNRTIATPTVPSVNTPQEINVGGKFDGNITISLDGSTETLSFSENDKKEMMKSIKNEIIKGTTAILSGGYTDGKTANTNI
jgi:hypothetical protein